MTILVAGIGNIFLGDDGFGHEVVRHLAAPDAPALPDGVRLVDYGIRGMHLAYDLLAGYDALVIVDAYPGPAEPGVVQVLEVQPDDIRIQAGAPGLDAHSMDPLAVLNSLTALGGRLPSTYLVGARPLDLGDGIGLTPTMAAAVPHAADAVRTLLAGRLVASAGGGRARGV